MALFNFNKPEPREFNYKPRFYTPEEEKPTGDHRRDFAEELHREWSGKLRHDKDRGSMPLDHRRLNALLRPYPRYPVLQILQIAN